MPIDATDDGFRVLYLESDGPVVSTANDTSDLIGNAWSDDASLIAIPVERLDPAFFDLRSGLAGEIAQKLVNYRLQLAVLGDISAHVAASDALRDWVWESNRGEHIWFLTDADALRERLATRRR